MVVVPVLLSAMAFATGFGLLAVLFRLQVRRYDRTVATEVLDRWKARRELLDPAERDRTPPPAKVLAAMVMLPAPGLRTGWNDLPARSVDR